MENTAPNDRPVIQPTKPPTQPSSLPLVLLVGLFIVCLAGMGFLFWKNKQLQKIVSLQSKPAPVLTHVLNPTIEAQLYSGWVKYTNDECSFDYPTNWLKKQQVEEGSGFTQEFTHPEPERPFTLTFKVHGNYNQVTGKPYSTLDEYEGLSYKTKTVMVDGVEGRQALPRAGSEHIYRVDFFSKDKKSIYSLALQIGDSSMNVSESLAAKGKELFDHIVSSFKFTVLAWLPYRESLYGVEIQYPSIWKPTGSQFMYKNRYVMDLGVIESTETLQQYLATQDLGNKNMYQVQSTKSIYINGLSCIQRSEYQNGPKSTRISTYCKNGTVIAIIVLNDIPGMSFETNKVYYDKAILTVKIPASKPTVTPAAVNMNTYTDNNHLFSFQYPSDWEINSTDSSHRIIQLTKKDLTQEKVIMPGDTIEDATYTIAIHLPPNQIYEIPTTAENIQIGGKPAKRFTEPAAPSSGQSIVVIVGTDNPYTLTYGAMAHSETHTKYVPVFNQVLSTFKFTEGL